MSKSRRDVAAPIIAAVLRQCDGLDEKATRAALREAYPWGERRYHPYKVWCDEIARQQGRKPALGTRAPREPEPDAVDPNQTTLWGDL